MAEARLEDTGGGLAPAAEGCFVVNVRDSSWLSSEVLGDCCIFEGGEVEFPELGFTIAVLESGQRSELALHHGAGVAEETTSLAEAYASFPKWQSGKPDFDGLPWA